MAKNMKIKLFDGHFGVSSGRMEQEVNEFLNRKDIEACDVQISNQPSGFVVCVLYKPAENLND